MLFSFIWHGYSTFDVGFYFEKSNPEVLPYPVATGVL